MTRRRRPALNIFGLTLALVLGVSLLTGLGKATTEAGGETGFDGNGQVVIRAASMVLTMDPALGTGPPGQLADADVLMEGNRIKAVGKNLDGGHARVVDGRGKIVLPGFVDLHNHLWQALIRGCAGDNELNGWLGRCVLPFYRNAPVTDWSHAFNADFARGNLRALDESKLGSFSPTTAPRTPRCRPRSGASSERSSTRTRWHTCKSARIRRRATTRASKPRRSSRENSASR
jgi:5-methylthioadenosine/S-adenosylhomocysteine deaminase